MTVATVDGGNIDGGDNGDAIDGGDGGDAASMIND